MSLSLFEAILLINKVRKPWVITFRILRAFSIQQNHQEDHQWQPDQEPSRCHPIQVPASSRFILDSSLHCPDHNVKEYKRTNRQTETEKFQALLPNGQLFPCIKTVQILSLDLAESRHTEIAYV
jgi:hypothetical protein